MKNQYEKQIEQLEKEFNRKKAELEQESIKSKEHAIPEKEREAATILHDCLCHHNHTDGCGWYYDKGNWKEYSRQEYLKKARKLLTEFNIEEIHKFINPLKGKIKCSQ